MDGLCERDQRIGQEAPNLRADLMYSLVANIRSHCIPIIFLFVVNMSDAFHLDPIEFPDSSAFENFRTRFQASQRESYRFTIC